MKLYKTGMLTQNKILQSLEVVLLTDPKNVKEEIRSTTDGATKLKFEITYEDGTNEIAHPGLFILRDIVSEKWL